MKKIISVLLTVLLTLLSFTACNGGKENNKDNSNYFVASKLAKTKDGRVYVEVNNKPMLYTGAQVRIDGYVHLDNIPFDDLEEQFVKASSINVNTVQLPLCWKDLEPEEGKYNLRSIRKLLDWAHKYNLKIEFLWFTYQVGNLYCPDYIWQDEETYPKYQSDNKGAVYGKHGPAGYLVYSTPKLLERECLMIEKLTDCIYDWEETNGFPVIVTGYQIHNEPDNFPRWGIAQQNVKLPDGSRLLTDKEAWNEVLTSLDNAGKAFKRSKWRAITRVNLTTLSVSNGAWENFAPRVFNLEGIDMVGDDTYQSIVSQQSISLNNLKSDIFEGGNFSHIAENSANFKNTASLILSAILGGSGYLIYCLQLPFEYIRYETNRDYWEQGLFNTDGTEKEHTDKVRKILYGLKNAGDQLVVAKEEDMVAFNVNNDFPIDETTQNAEINSIKFTFETKNGSLGFAVYYDGYLTVYFDKDSEIKFDNGEYSKAEYGTFKGAEFTKLGETNLDKNLLKAEGGKLYRIKVDNTTF